MRVVTETRRMNQGDLAGASNVHREVFERQMNSFKWLSCNLKAYPRILCYVAKDKVSIVGYIIWTQKSGFRHQAIIELEQIAVTPIHQGKGVGQALIERTLPLVKHVLESNGSQVKHIIVTTRADNHAQQLFRKNTWR
ncbi:MAG: GNAT family N-acetyltransferase [Nitrospira sp.]|nr:GNAT family N-acetyltransferase [Nitrospira sp.]